MTDSLSFSATTAMDGEDTSACLDVALHLAKTLETACNSMAKAAKAAGQARRA